ncbi:hypothetical protein [Desulfonauticus submarinus]
MIKQEWQKKFKLNFFEKCCKLICDAKPANKPIYLSDKRYKNKKVEDFITYEYVEKIKDKCYQKKISVSCGSIEKRGNNPDYFVNPDITFSNLSNTFKTFFECKILGDNSKYIGDDGIQRFVIEKYAFRNMPFYGMLGYVKDANSAILKYKTLKKSIDNKKNCLNLTKQEIIENSDSQVIFKTKHIITNAKCNPKIEITHILHSW